MFPIDSLYCFSPIELEEMICGMNKDEEWAESLDQHVLPQHGYHHKSQEYKNFLRFMKELKPEERRLFLRFVTGCPRLPLGGFAALDPKLTVVLRKANPGQSPDEFLPSVMTC